MAQNRRQIAVCWINMCEINKNSKLAANWCQTSFETFWLIDLDLDPLAHKALGHYIFCLRWSEWESPFHSIFFTQRCDFQLVASIFIRSQHVINFISISLTVNIISIVKDNELFWNTFYVCSSMWRPGWTSEFKIRSYNEMFLLETNPGCMVAIFVETINLSWS